MELDFQNVHARSMGNHGTFKDVVFYFQYRYFDCCYQGSEGVMSPSHALLRPLTPGKRRNQSENSVLRNVLWWPIADVCKIVSALYVTGHTFAKRHKHLGTNIASQQCDVT